MEYKDLIQTISTVLAIFLSFILGRMESKRKYISDIKSTRYNELYVPYIKFLYSLEIEQINLFEEFPRIEVLNKRREFLNLLATQLKFLDEKTLKYYNDYCSIYFEIECYPNNSTEMIKNKRFIPKESKEIFCLLTVSLLEEAIKLSNELKLPKLGGPFLNKYHQELKMLRHQ